MSAQLFDPSAVVFDSYGNHIKDCDFVVIEGAYMSYLKGKVGQLQFDQEAGQYVFNVPTITGASRVKFAEVFKCKKIAEQ